MDMALMEELVEEILVRIPPDEPAHLFRAALVCKPWRRILSHPGFLRRYRALHRAPPLLGYFYNRIRRRHGNPGLSLTPPIVSTTAVPPLDSSGVNSWAHDCRHGRVLIEDATGGLIVWDPITGDKKKLSVPKHPLHYRVCAVLCAVDGCDHLNCHAGPFQVVYCGTNLLANEPFETWATMYSSETKQWSALISIDVDHCLDSRPTRLIRNALYFSLGYGVSMLKYDLIRHELSMISLGVRVRGAVAMELDDGGLGFVAMLDRCIYRWSWKADANNGVGKWAEDMVMQLDTLLTEGNPHFFYRVVGFVEGTDTIFISAYAGLFTLDLKSKKVKKVGKKGDYYRVLPYMSFYTRDLAKGGLSL